MKDLLIGAVDKYSWDNVRNWAKSIRQSGFDGRVVLLCYRITDARIPEECHKLNIDTALCETDLYNRPINHTDRGRDTQSHQMRFFHAWQVIKMFEDSRYVIMTDVRDVIFQSNPSIWLDTEWRRGGSYQIYAPSEGLLYRDEPWGKENMLQGYGPVVWEQMVDTPIANVGTIMGDTDAMKQLCLLIYSMGEGRYIPNDQSTFNLLRNISTNIRFLPMSTGWAAQCGTTLDPEKAPLFQDKWQEPLPKIKDGLVYTADDVLFSLVHQYDRVPTLKPLVDARYQ